MTANRQIILLLAFMGSFSFLAGGCEREKPHACYPQNPPPLLPSVFSKLPLGSVKPQGWLKEQLMAMKSGLTGNLEDFWPDLLNSAWKGGDGEAWERGPYYLDGMIPLAFLLDDESLQQKAKVWIEAIIKSQRDDGWFGPAANNDRWPLAVACKALTSYYEATGEEHVLTLLDGYFSYLNNHPPDWPDSTWRGVRAMENAVSGYWLYRRTKDPLILNTIRSISENSFNWTQYYYDFPWDSTAVAEHLIPQNWNKEGLNAHVVNNAMAIKYPGLWYQQSAQLHDKSAVFTGIQKYDLNHGQVGGRFSGDEHLSGKRPTQGTELCAVVEYMFSLEKLIEIFPQADLADRLEFLAYNALPGAMTADGWAHQYDQQTNQVLVSNEPRAWSSNGSAANIYGLMPNYPCCLANMHQGWPKFCEHLWMASRDGGLALIAYAPSTVSAKVGKGKTVTISEKTNYPFDGSISLSFSMKGSARFPLYIRIPAWAEGSVIRFHEKTRTPKAGTFFAVQETWEDGDEIMIVLPSRVSIEERFNKAVAIRHGPLYFALRIEKEFEHINLKSKSYYSIDYKGSADWAIKPLSAWNYALWLEESDPAGQISVNHNPIYRFPFADMGDLIYNEASDQFEPWPHQAPLVLSVKGIIIPGWKMKQNSAADPPCGAFKTEGEAQEIQLVPYGCARLRVAEFPVYYRTDAH